MKAQAGQILSAQYPTAEAVTKTTFGPGVSDIAAANRTNGPSNSCMKTLITMCMMLVAGFAATISEVLTTRETRLAENAQHQTNDKPPLSAIVWPVM